MIEAVNLSKRYGRFSVLDRLQLHIGDNEFVGLMGRNGTGKTTLLKILSLLIKPSGGELKFDGKSSKNYPETVLNQIGLVSHQVFLYGDLSARENLNFFARMYDVPDAGARINDLLKRVGLEHRANDPARKFSRGMQQRLSIARALIHSPKLLLLDEPYTGLDTGSSALLDEMIQEFHHAGNTVILVSHDIEQALKMTKRLLVLNKGAIAWDCQLKADQLDDARLRLIEFLN